MWLVTGGAGFIGSHIVHRLVRDGQSVRVLDNLATGHLESLDDVRSQIDFVNGDIRDEATVRAAMRGVRVILHHAAQPSVPLSVEDPVGTYAVNLGGTMNLLNAAREFGAQRFVLASTSAIYGDDPTSPKMETQFPRPISPYASSKLAAEHLCAVYHRCYGLESVALRYFNVFGPGQDPNSAYAAVIPRMIELLQRGELPIIYGDGEQTRDFIFVEDVVEANLRAAVASVEPGGIFNIASGRPTSLNDLLRALSGQFGVAPTADYQPERVGDIRHSLAEASKASAELGFTARTTLVDGLARTLVQGRMLGVA
jgi:nucleoside-diphosphate-sugar epimerase